MKLVISVTLFCCLVTLVQSVRFSPRGFGFQRRPRRQPIRPQILPSVFNSGGKPKSVQNFQQQNPIQFPPAFTDEFSDTRNIRQLASHISEPKPTAFSPFPSIFPDSFYNGFFSEPSNQQPIRHFRKKKDLKQVHTIPYKRDDIKFRLSSEKSKPALAAHKLRKKYPYYGRKRRSAERRTRRPNILFGLPFDFFNEANNSEDKFQTNVRTQRRVVPLPPQTQFATNTDQYLASSGIPLYKYRNKHPHGYGRKKRSPQFPGNPYWTLLDPLTGRTLEPQTELKNEEFKFSNFGLDPLEEQFTQSQTRLERIPAQVEQQPGNQKSEYTDIYLDNAGRPVYKHYKRYPYSG